MINYTAKYTKLKTGYMGQLVEWPEVVTEGNDRWIGSPLTELLDP